MAEHFIITADLRELIGDIDFTRIQAAVTTNLPPGSVVVDKVNKQLNLGVGPVPISLDGTVTMSLLQTNAPDTSVSGWRYWLEITAPEHAVGRKALRQERPVYRIGPFAATNNGNLADLSDQFETPATSPEWRDAIVEATKDTLGEMYGLLGALGGVRNPDALASYRAKDVGTSVRKVVLIGDSITDGALASAYSKTYAQRLQAKLRAASGVVGGGIGYVPATPSTGGAITPAIPNTRAGSPQDWSHGLGGRAMYLTNTSTHHVTYDAQPTTQVKVYYGQTTVAGGSLKVQIDGVDQGVTLQCATTGSNKGGLVWTSPPLAPGNHVVKVVPGTNGFVGILEGVEFINGDETSGIRVYNGGHSGGTFAQFNIANMALHWQSVATINPDLTAIMLGANDVASASTAAQILTNADTMIAKVAGPILLVGCYLRGDYQTDTGRAKWEQIQAGLRARAVEGSRIAYVDLAPHWPVLEASGTTSAGLMGDVPPIHPNDAGMEKIASVLTTALSPIVASTLVGPQGPPGANAIPTKTAVDTYGAELLGESSTLRSTLVSQLPAPATPVGAAVKQAVDTRVPELITAPSAARSALDARYGAVFTPEAYGAVGDGVADDTAAVTAAFAAATALRIAGIGGNIWHPGGTVHLRAGATYRLNTLAGRIVASCNIDGGGANLVVPAAYGGAVLLVGHETAGNVLHSARGSLPSITSLASAGTYAAGSVGVVFHNLYASDMRCSRISKVETGIWFTGHGEVGTAYNAFYPGWVDFCKVGWRFDSGPAGTGWANQNVIYAGEVAQSPDSVGERRTGFRHLVMDGGSGYTVHGNTFVGASFEGNVSEHTIYLHNATDNVWTGTTRFEQGVYGKNVVMGITTSTPSVLYVTGHGLSVGDMVTFTATTAPGGMTMQIPYYVRTIAGDGFTITTTPGGSTDVVHSSAGSNVKMLRPPRIVFDNSDGLCRDNVFENYNTWPGPIEVKRLGAAAPARRAAIIG